jgi:hypothetical protein
MSVLARAVREDVLPKLGRLARGRQWPAELRMDTEELIDALQQAYEADTGRRPAADVPWIATDRQSLS